MEEERGGQRETNWRREVKSYKRRGGKAAGVSVVWWNVQNEELQQAANLRRSDCNSNASLTFDLSLESNYINWLCHCFHDYLWPNLL